MAQTYRNRVIWGFTLVELMVGITISIIVITIAVNIYFYQKKLQQSQAQYRAKYKNYFCSESIVRCYHQCWTIM